MADKKKISVLTPCYNEEGNIAELVDAVKAIFDTLPQYTYEHVIIDNHSADNTVPILRTIAAKYNHVKVILNARNFGHVRSPFHGLRQCHGEAVISIVADFQDPVEMIPQLLQKWEEGYKIVVGVKNKSKESSVMFGIRTLFYKTLARFADNSDKPIENFTGFGLYDQSFIEVLRTLDDPYPYFRGLITELGYDVYKIKFTQPLRKHGQTKNNFFTLYDLAMLGFINHSKLPLRLSAFIGFVTAMLSFLVAVVYFIYKLIFWSKFSAGSAPMVIGLFFFSSVQLFFIGVIGEYIGAIHTQVRKRPLVIEKERINFDK